MKTSKIILSITFFLNACQHDADPVNQHLSLIPKTIDTPQQLYRFQKNKDDMLSSIQVSDKSLSHQNVFTYTYNQKKLKMVFADFAKHEITESENEVSILTHNDIGEAVFLDIFTYRKGKLVSSVNFHHNNLNWVAENKKDFYYYPDGNLKEVMLFTIYQNQWKKYGAIQFSDYNQIQNTMAAIDLLTLFKDLYVPVYLELNNNIFTHHPGIINYYAENGELLITRKLTYSFSHLLRSNITEQTYINSILTDSKNYRYTFD